MKTRLLWALLSWLSLLSFGAQAQTVLASEGFENGTGYGYTASPTITGVDYQYFERRGFDTPDNSSSTYLDAETPLNTGSGASIRSIYGTYLWTAEGVRGSISNSTNRSAKVVQLRSITTSGYRNLRMVVAFASARPSTMRDVATTDRIRLQYSFNNGASWITAGLLLGNNGTAGRFQQDTSVPLDSIADSNGMIVDQTLRDYTANISGTGASLLVRVVADTRIVSFAFDNIRVLGDVDNTAKPTLNIPETTPASYNEGGSPVQLSSGLTVGYSDNSATNITGATVNISNGFVAGDQLNFTSQPSITGSYSMGTGVLTLTGTTTQAAYQAVLRSITYSNTNVNTLPSGTRQITFQISNGSVTSSSPVRVVNVTQALNAPAALTATYTEPFTNDGEGLRYVSDMFYSATGPVGFFRSTTNPPSYNGNALSSTTYGGNISGGFWYGEGTTSAFNPKAPFSTLRLAPVNASGYNKVRFTLALGASGSWAPYQNTDNLGDWFELFYSPDGGTTLTKFGAFYGTSARVGPLQDDDLNPATPTTPSASLKQLSSTLQDIQFDLPSAALVSNLTFVLRQRASINAEIAFDNIRITGVMPPTVTTTTPATNLTATSATLGGTVTADGQGTLSERGVVYVAGTGTPTTSNTKALVATTGIVVGTAFSGTVSGLTASTQYTARAYAINEVGTSYGANVTFTTLTPTTVTSIVRTTPTAAITNATSVVYTVTFGAAVTGLTASNFDLLSPIPSGASIGILAGSGTTYTVTVNTGTGNGSLTLRLANATNILPGISTALPFAGETYTIDKTAPTVSSVAVPANGSYRATQTLDFTVNFSEAVTVTGSPQLGLTIGSTSRQANYLSGSGSAALVFRYTLQAGDLDADGIALASALSLNGGTLKDAAGNNATLTLNGVPSTTGIVVDAVAPTAAISSSLGGSGTFTATTPIPFTVTFSESVTGFAASDVTVSNGTVTGFTGSGTAYTFNVTPTTSGAVTVNVAAAVAKDAAGNDNTAATAFIINYEQPLVATSRAVTVQLDANGNGTLQANAGTTGVNNGSTGSGTLTYTIQKIVYGKVSERNTLTFTTPSGDNFTGIRFANYGTPIDNGGGNYRLGNCNAANSVTTATNSFVNRSTGSMDASNLASANNNPALGDPCGGTPKFLALQVAYSADAASLTYTCTEAGKTQYVLLTVRNGSSTSTSVAQVTVVGPPTATLTSVSPNPALPGATVTVNGTNLSGVGGGSVTLNGAVLTPRNISATSFQVTLPNTATSGPLLVNLACSQTLAQPLTVTPTCLVTVRIQNVSVILGADGTASVSASAVDNGSSSTCGAVSVRVSPNTFTCANLGINPVTLTVTAPDGTQTTALATVTVSLPALASTTWTGTVSTDWGDCRNWSYGLVPTASLSALVPGGTPRYPSLTAGPYAVNSLSIASGASLATTASATLQLSGNFTNDGTATLAGRVQLVGTTNQTLGGQTTLTFSTIVLAKPTGTVVQLQRDLLIGTNLTLGGGTLATASYTVALGSSATIRETNESYVLGNVATTRTLAPGATETFGGLGLGLTPAAGSLAPGLTPVVRTTGTVLTGVGTSQSIKRYFDIQPTVDQGLNVELVFGYFEHELNTIAAANLVVFKSATTAGPWLNQGQSGRTADALTASGTVRVAGISSLSIWTLGDVTNPLPVTLTSFTATASGAGAGATVRLAWATASEVNSKVFEVERSLDGVAFAKTGEVAAAGTSTQAHRYALSDGALPAGASRLYYRLRQVDQDGMAHYSVVRAVALSAASLSLYPNPAHERTVTLLGAQPGTRVTVLDAVGRQVFSASVSASGTALLALPPESAAGVYVVRTGAQALRLTLE